MRRQLNGVRSVTSFPPKVILDAARRVDLSSQKRRFRRWKTGPKFPGKSSSPDFLSSPFFFVCGRPAILVRGVVTVLSERRSDLIARATQSDGQQCRHHGLCIGAFISHCSKRGGEDQGGRRCHASGPMGGPSTNLCKFRGASKNLHLAGTHRPKTKLSDGGGGQTQSSHIAVDDYQRVRVTASR